MKKESYVKILFLLIGILAGLLVVLIFVSDISQVPYSVQFIVHGYTEENAVAICSGMNLKKTSHCLNSFVKGIYQYKSRKDSETPSFTELVEEGGDCRNWQMLYCELGMKIGYACTKVSIPVERRDNILYKHTWAVLTSNEGYCNLDQKDLNCFMYK